MVCPVEESREFKVHPPVSAANGDGNQRRGKTSPSVLLQEGQDSVNGHSD